MSFLGHHFYIDAGVILSDSAQEDVAVVEDKLKALEVSGDDEARIPTISAENTNIENMSDDDLKELETSTTNITDDVKANLQKKSLTNLTGKAKAGSESVRKRNKRYSCVFSSDLDKTSKAIKRRSLNISETSRIPISFKRQEEKRGKPGQQNSDSRLPLQTGNDANENNWKKSVVNGNLVVDTSNNNGSNATNVDKAEVKENVPITKSSNRVNVPNRCPRDNVVAKVSNLPVLVR
ncbi:hypothetical protein NQ315_006237 [Exocentrus adspersus]|uniref:Uncharacterized protein n=1 Tax=Exocentrus adspersus TaxID=1586481 RepID=A0AAV8W086_9CUCU|nr:hypothetical protein NQ315_006237 [Exocentrus adspersus]